MDDAQRNLIRGTFDAVADSYDHPALRFFGQCAAAMAHRLTLRGDEQVLDVACGTGHVTVAVAPHLPAGRVTAVDFSPAMLVQARAKAGAAGLANVDFVEADMQTLPWQGRFDAAVCGFVIFFVEDIDTQLGRIARTVKPGGRVVISSFAHDYMEPMRSLMMARLARFGVTPPPGGSWLRIATVEGCRDFFDRSGLTDIAVEQRDFGYFLAGPGDWWNVIWNAGFRRLISRVPAAEQPRFQAEHLAEVAALTGPEGLAMPVPVLLTVGTVPAGTGRAAGADGDT
jgi:ubiquinone/menaquinone biosynthesis C-methylase UbiE